MLKIIPMVSFLSWINFPLSKLTVFCNYTSRSLITKNVIVNRFSCILFSQAVK